MQDKSFKEQHLEDLGYRHNVRVFPEPEYDRRASMLIRNIHSGVMHLYACGWDGSGPSYIAAMHEFGHVACGQCEAQQDEDYWWNILEKEAEASLWAIYNSIVEPDDAAVAWIRAAHESYMRAPIPKAPPGGLTQQLHAYCEARVPHSQWYPHFAGLQRDLAMVEEQKLELKRRFDYETGLDIFGLG